MSGGGGGKRREFASRVQGMPSANARLIAASTVSTVRGGGGSSPGLGGGGRSRISQEQLAGISSSNVMAGIARGQIVGGPRQHVAKREEAHRPVSSTPSAHTLSVAEQEGVEPIDYEEFVSQQSERDPLGWVSFHHHLTTRSCATSYGNDVTWCFASGP